MSGEDRIPGVRHEYVFHDEPDGPEFRYDPVSERLFREGAQVPLQPRAASVLGHLLAEHGRLVSRDELIDDVWEGMPVADASVTEAVALVRSALGDARQEPSFIQTVPKRGYRFIAPVERAPRQAPRARRVTESRKVPRWAVPALAILVAGLLGWWALGGVEEPALPSTVAVRLAMSLPAPARTMEAEGPALALSPDGRRLVYVAATAGEGSRLHVVDLESGADWPLERSAGRPRAPFLSPEGEAVAFFQRGRLLVASLAAGPAARPEPLASLPRSLTAGGSWHDSGRIVVSPGVGHGLHELEAGQPDRLRTLTSLGPGERGHLTPELLPDGSVLFSVLGEENGPRRVEMVDGAGERRVIGVPGGVAPRFVPPGTLVFARSRSLFSAPLEISGSGLRLGEPRPVVPEVRDGGRAPPHFATSREGTLALLPAPDEARAALHWIDPDGRVERVDATLGQPLDGYRISPDGRRLVGGRGGDLWTFDLVAGSFRQLTASPRLETAPIWGPGPGQVTFAASTGRDGLEIRIMDVETTGSSRMLLEAAGEQVPEHWSAGGDRLLFTRLDATSGEDLWIMGASGEVRPLVVTDAAERGGRFSPDGRWVAFVSDRSGSDEVWLRGPRDGDDPIRLTRGGGALPRWGASGDTLFFRRGAGLYRLAVRSGSGAQQERLVSTEPDPGFFYDLEPRGTRVLVHRHGTASWQREVLLVQAWRRRGSPLSEP